FDRKTATSVAKLLMTGATSKDREDGADAGGGLGRRVLFDPIPLYPNPDIDPDVWEQFATIPSVTIPKHHVKPIKRLTALATALSKDGLVQDAVAIAHDHLHRGLDGRAVQYQTARSEEHTSELQSRFDLVCRLLLEKKKKT